MAVGAGGALYLGPLATLFPIEKLRFPEPRLLTQGYLPLLMTAAPEETEAAGFLVGSGEEGRGHNNSVVPGIRHGLILRKRIP